MANKKFRVIIGALLAIALVASFAMILMIQVLVPWGLNEITIFNNLLIFTISDLALVFWIVVWNYVFKKLPNRRFLFANQIIKKEK